MLSRVRRRPLHAAKRPPRRRPQLRAPVHLHLRVPRPHLHMPSSHLRVPRPHVRMPSSPAPVAVALVARCRVAWTSMPLERRRARTMLGAAIVAALVVLLSSFPLGGVLSQRSALSSTAHELTTVQAENDALSSQVADLTDPATIEGLARLDYGFVPRGQRAYDILPAAIGSGSAASGSGQVPLSGPPVVPGSARSQALIGIVSPAATVSAAHGTRGARSGDSGGDQSAEPRSYWGRVVRSLEFWT